jgi:hypothetical protein
MYIIYLQRLTRRRQESALQARLIEKFDLFEISEYLELKKDALAPATVSGWLKPGI